MNTSGYIIAILVLAVVISVATGYLLLYKRKKGRDSMDEKSETQEGKSIDRLEKMELPTIKEEINHEALEKIAQGVEEVLLSNDDEELLVSPEETQRPRPIDRVGRRPHRAEGEKSQVCEGKPRRLKPEIVCWEKGREWILAVEISEEIYRNGDLEVAQNSSQLEQDVSREHCWHLTQAFGKVAVNSTEVYEVDLGKEGENVLLFKLSGQDRKEGRLVKSPSSGEYLVIVPADWKLANEAHASIEQINMKSYQAYWHVFDTVDNRRMVFATSKGEKKIQSKSPRFRLIGTSLNDASYMGPLFGENPPQISVHDIADWDDVGTIIIGEIGESGWRMEIPLTLDDAVQTLPTEVLERQSGWYFLRFYDKHDNLKESLDFRYVLGLKTIKVPRPQPFPTEEKRHELACVEIMHESDCVIEPADTVSSDIRIECTEVGTVLPIPPNPAYDKTRWRIGYGPSAQVEITILVERIWWSIGIKTKVPAIWRDQFEPLPKESFSTISNVALWLRFPTQRWVNKVRVGFQREHAREFPAAVTEQTICIPLRNFEVRDCIASHFLRVWVERGGKQYEGTVAVVSALRPDWVGYGRKKSAIAVAMMRKGTGEMEINGFPIADYFQRAPSEAKLFWQRLHDLDPIRDILSQLDISFRVRGSSPNTKRQWMAVAHALAHALMNYQPDLSPMLKREGFGGTRVTKSACIGKEGLLDESD